MVFRYQEKHSCTLTSVEKIQINMLMRGKQPTTQPSEQSCSLGVNPCVTWHISLSSAHAHHCLKKEKANYSVLVRSTAWVTCNLANTRACSVETVPLLREKLKEGETCQHQLRQQERSWNKAAAAASETAGTRQEPHFPAEGAETPRPLQRLARPITPYQNLIICTLNQNY